MSQGREHVRLVVTYSSFKAKAKKNDQFGKIVLKSFQRTLGNIPLNTKHESGMENFHWKFTPLAID